MSSLAKNKCNLFRIIPQETYNFTYNTQECKRMVICLYSHIISLISFTKLILLTFLENIDITITYPLYEERINIHVQTVL